MFIFLEVDMSSFYQRVSTECFNRVKKNPKNNNNKKKTNKKLALFMLGPSILTDA